MRTSRAEPGSQVPPGNTTARIATLDIIRGVAVMGILAMNIVAFAMPLPAYMNPMAYGTHGPADLVSFALAFIFVDGKMRGLFSLLFGASMLLVAERAEAAGLSATSLTCRRLLWLLLFGALHFYLIWDGDILFAYALTGLAAWCFRRLDPVRLIVLGGMLVAMQLALFGSFAASAWQLSAEIARPGPAPEVLQSWQMFTQMAGIPDRAELARDMILYLGSWRGLVDERLASHFTDPLVNAIFYFPETLAYMLFGMAGLKTGFLSGAWPDRSYRRIMATGLAIGIPASAALLLLIFAGDFSVTGLTTWSLAATVAVRPPMIVAYAALIILATRGGGALVERIAAAGRAAFTNYIGTSIAITGLFYGWGAGLYGSLGRAELWLVVIPAWAVMLAWSKPWLDRFRYGPFEWAWRSLARGRWQPLRRPRPVAVSISR